MKFLEEGKKWWENEQKELLKLLETLQVDAEEFWILSSASLVLRGILTTASDLDIAVTKKGLRQLQGHYHLTPREVGGFVITSNIECICEEKENLKFQPAKIGDYYVQNLEVYLEFLENSKREKDKLRIPRIKEYLRQNPDKH